MTKAMLYGDGVRDDTAAIQALLDSGISEVALPAPEKHYTISRTLRIHSGQTLRLGETTKIRLLPGSDCFMLTNAEKPAHDISVVGGIWDYDNVHQRPNPARTGGKMGPWHSDGKADTVVVYDDTIYRGSIMRFYRVERFSIHDLTFKDPVTYCLEMAYMRYFTVENIRFDMNLGNPTAENMDGIHVDGGCRFGSIRNVQGSCYDDVVALNADDGCDGPIEDIVVDGVLGEHSLRAVRLLSTKSRVANISISNVSGTYYQNAVSITYHFPRTGVRGTMSHISLRNICGENSHRLPEYGKGDESHYMFSFLWVDGDLDIDSLTVDNLFRREEISDAETIHVCKNAHIHTMTLENVQHQNFTGRPLALMHNEGHIDRLYMTNVDAGDDKLLRNDGEIDFVSER